MRAYRAHIMACNNISYTIPIEYQVTKFRYIDILNTFKCEFRLCANLSTNNFHQQLLKITS